MPLRQKRLARPEGVSSVKCGRSAAAYGFGIDKSAGSAYITILTAMLRTGRKHMEREWATNEERDINQI